jgi:hypothetical protein
MKKRNVFLLGLLVVLLAMGLVLVGCGDDSSGDNGSNDSGGNDNSGNNNSGGATPGIIIMRNRTGVTIVRIGLNQGDSLLQNFNVNVRNEEYYTITNVSPGTYFLTIFDNVSGYYPVPLMVSRNLTVTNGQTVTWEAR